jgi:hypothetical protein
MLYAMADCEKRRNGRALPWRTAVVVSGVEQVRLENKPEER